jgi:cytochrome c553
MISTNSQRSWPWLTGSWHSLVMFVLVASAVLGGAAGRCASCHGEDFAGSKAVARVAGQHEEYITKALHDYKLGLRSGGGVAAMAEVAYPLSDDEITALAHYLALL